MWKAIEQSYQQQAFAKRSQLKMQFHTLKQGSNFVAIFCDPIKKIYDSLKSIGETVSDLDLVLQTLQGLNSSYNTFVLNVENTDPPSSFMQLRSRLLLYEERMLQQSDGVPISAMATLKLGNPPHSTLKDNTTVVCQICHKQNHTAERCYFRYESNDGNQNGRIQGRNNGGNQIGGGRSSRFNNWRGRFGGRGVHRGAGRRGLNSNPNFSNLNSYDTGDNRSGYVCSTYPGYINNGLNGPNVDSQNHNQFSSVSGPISQTGSDCQFSGNGLHNNFGFGANLGVSPQAFSATFGPTHFANWATQNGASVDTNFSETCALVDSWIPDSGATNHMTSNPRLVHGTVPYTGPETVIVGNDTLGNCPPPHSA